MSKKRNKQIEIIKDINMENQEIVEQDDNDINQEELSEVPEKEVLVEVKDEIVEVVKPIIETPIVIKKEDNKLLPKIDTPVELSTGTTRLLNQLVEGGNELSINTIKQVLGYVESMAPGLPMEASGGNKRQLDFYRSIVYLINNDNVDNFPLVYGLILKIIDEFSEKGAFAPTHVFRFVNETHTNKEEIKGFNSLINLLTATANNQSRANSIKMIDFNRTLAIGFNEIGRSRVLNFYSK